MKFQLIDINDDEINFNYLLTLYGRTDKNQTIVISLKNFKPSFYVRLPNDNIQLFRNLINDGIKSLP